MTSDGRADCTQDRRFYALVLLATFTTLRRDEATALKSVIYRYSPCPLRMPQLAAAASR